MFGFDLSNDTEYDIAENIIIENWSYIIIKDLIRGWKVAKDLPSWVKKVNSWNKFVQKAENTNLGHMLDLDENKDANTKSDEEKNIKYIGNNGNESNVSDNDEDDVKLMHSDDDFDGLYDSMDSEKEKDKSHTPNTKLYMSHHDNIKEHDDEDNTSEEDTVKLLTRSNTKMYMSQRSNNKHSDSDDYTSEDEKVILVTRSNTTMDKFHHNNKKRNESDEDDSSLTVGMGNGYSNNNVNFETLFDNNFKSKFEDNVKTASKPSTMEVFVTGPFHKSNTGMSYYVVVFGDLNKAFVLKSMFMKTYLATVLSVSGLNKECDNCNTFYDFNISKIQFGHGDDNCWKRSKTGKTISRLQFVYSCKSSQEKQIEKNLSRMIDVLFKSMEMRKANPIGKLVLDFLKQYQNGLYMYLTKNKSEEVVSTMLTEDIHNQFKYGYTITWNDNLNRFMVDYDIIRILKNDIGYKDWDDVGRKNMSKCYKEINNTFTQPQWGIEQERY